MRMLRMSMQELYVKAKSKWHDDVVVVVVVKETKVPRLSTNANGLYPPPQ
jgi:hypothetical protein